MKLSHLMNAIISWYPNFQNIKRRTVLLLHPVESKSLINQNVKMLWVNLCVNPHETITRPIGPPRGLKACCTC